VLTLVSPVQGSYSAGEDVSNSHSGSTRNYLLLSNGVIAQDWSRYTGVIDGVNQYNQVNSYSQFRRGTKYLCFFASVNRTVSGKTYFDNIRLSDSITGADVTADQVGSIPASSYPAELQNSNVLSGYNLQPKSSNFTMASGSQYIVTVSTANITATLPSAPSANDWVELKVFNSGSNKLIIGRNSSDIEGVSEDMDVECSHISFSLVYDSSKGWVLM
jgi:hypothetical protein